MDGVPKSIAVGAAQAYQLAAADIEAHWGPRSVAALVATPSNPTGTLVSDAELRAIHRAVSARGGSLIVDEI
jgi:aspartate/methionine/tyrosine aminotransferase